MKNPVRAYYISDVAYDRLTMFAQKARYVKFGASRAKGMSEFLSDLALKPLEDTRPPFTKERHAQEVAYGHAPTWLQYHTRRARLLSLTEDAVARYFKVGYQVGIIKAEPYAIGGPDRRTPYPTVAYVLEGIGLKWLTPVNDDWPLYAR